MEPRGCISCCRVVVERVCLSTEEVPKRSVDCTSKVPTVVTQFWDKGLGLIECDLLWLYLRSRQVRKSLCGSPEQACEGKKEEVGMILIPARRVHVARDQVGEAWDASRDSTDQPSFQTSTGTRVVCVPTRRQSEDAAFCASNGVAVYLCAGRRERDDFEMGGRWASDWDIPRDSCSGCRFLNVNPPTPPTSPNSRGATTTMMMMMTRPPTPSSAIPPSSRSSASWRHRLWPDWRALRTLRDGRVCGRGGWS